MKLDILWRVDISILFKLSSHYLIEVVSVCKFELPTFSQHLAIKGQNSVSSHHVLWKKQYRSWNSLIDSESNDYKVLFTTFHPDSETKYAYLHGTCIISFLNHGENIKCYSPEEIWDLVCLDVQMATLQHFHKVQIMGTA